tara:strand:+ start:170 stop:922 length:753 start_codon:yes stop_codon:yes gene_type:complete
MAIDLDALRKKHEELTRQNVGGGSDFLANFMQLKEGTNVVRILPGTEDDSEFYAETKIHRITDEEGKVSNVHCRKVHGENCPLCDVYFALWKTGSDDDANTARQIKPRNRYYLNVVDRETGDVKILSIGIKIFQKIIGAMLDADYGDISDLQEGHDFKVIKNTEGQWPNYDNSVPRPRPEPAGSDVEVATWMDSLHDIQALVRFEDYEEVKEVAQSIMPNLSFGTPTERTATPSETDTITDAEYAEKLEA